MARESTLLVYRGEDVSIPFITYTADTGTAAQDITDWTLTFTVARAKNSTVKLLSKSGIIINASAGTWRVALDAADTQDIAPGYYFWDAWKTNTGSKRLLGYGRFAIGDSARLPA